MEKSKLPFDQIIFVCTNSRKPGERISCAGEGRCGEEILNRLRAYVKENRLEKKVRVAKSGCQERCEVGPNAVLLPQNQFFSHLSAEDAQEIIDGYLAPFC